MRTGVCGHLPDDAADVGELLQSCSSLMEGYVSSVYRLLLLLPPSPWT
jgi:hypothetical protein